MITAGNIIDCIHNMQRCDAVLRMAQRGLSLENVDTMYKDVLDSVRAMVQDTRKILEEIEEARNHENR